LLTWPLAIAGANIFHPSRMALYYDPTGTGALPLFAPVFRAGLSRRSFAPVFLASGNATLALNTTFILGIALTAWTMALVVLRWTGSTGGVLLAAWVLLTNAWLMAAWSRPHPTAQHSSTAR